MKIEIESVCNGYVITIPPVDDENFEKKIVIQNNEDDEQDFNESKTEFETFSNLVEQLQEILGICNSKHNTIGYVNGLCSENLRWDIYEDMKKSLQNPKSDTGD